MHYVAVSSIVAQKVSVQMIAENEVYIYMMDIYTYMCMYICMVYTQNPRLKRLTFLINMLQLLQGVQILF